MTVTMMIRSVSRAAIPLLAASRFASAFVAVPPSSRAVVSPFITLSRMQLRQQLQQQQQLKMSSSTTTTTTSEGGYSIDVSSYMTGPAPAGTEDYIMQQTMVRVKDPKKSLEFYCDVLGMKLVHYSEFPEWKFNVYFVAPASASHAPASSATDAATTTTTTTTSTSTSTFAKCMTVPGCIELTWNYGSEEEDGLVYNTGNADSTGTDDGEKIRGGFGHIGIAVPNVYTACERFKEMGVEFHKSPNSGGMKGLAFLKDPDGYLIEILPQGEFTVEDVDCMGVAAEGGEGYKDNSK